ncbi:DUF1934 domain-containing protein [Peptostreptococcus equinus]|uniref:DUF1934 domain-containing protein n=1 Tax=Peptostreptococcus equinus TaxID=3003601 RepID=A0ABY7JSG8_9FIRM|nr:DUF1934 domain-containing protein [Peptostreptococcus sp. CBA3647]WAW15003.1 DUF1934 domain-containing protein [Peptostreptococcus sp. CBA3647]
MNVKLKIRTSQIINKEQIDTIEETYSGIMIEKSASIFVKFDEISGENTSKGLIKISEDRIVVHRNGNINSKMIFIENQIHKTIYDAGSAVFDMVIHTKKIEKMICDKEMRIILHYSLNLDKLMDSENRVEIIISSEDCNDNR